MLGFATVDVAEGHNTLTVWLTSVQPDLEVAHTNAVTFDLGDVTTPRRAWDMACDRYVVLTDRTSQDHAVFAGWGLQPCDLTVLAKETTAAQNAVMAAFAVHSAKPGNKHLAEPTMRPVPPPVNQTALEDGAAQQLTLGVANQVMHIWAAWLAVERERVKRWSYMPGGQKGEKAALFPSEFLQQNVIQRIKVCTP